MAILSLSACGHNAWGQQTYVGKVETEGDLANPTLTVGTEVEVLEDGSRRIKKSDGSWAVKTSGGAVPPADGEEF